MATPIHGEFENGIPWPHAGYPAGSYPGGYHLETFGERYTNMGAEAYMTFIGPSLMRHELLRMFFHRWTVNWSEGSGGGNSCCVIEDAIAPNPAPYPDLAAVRLVGENRVCRALIPIELYADTWEMGPVEADKCTPYRVACSNLPADSLQSPLYYGGKTENYDAGAQITINFRRKHHGTFPQFMMPCTYRSGSLYVQEQKFWRAPVISWGTFIEVRQQPAIETRSVPSDGVRYQVDEDYRVRPAVDPVTNPQYDPCDGETVSPAQAAEFCAEVVDIPELDETERDKITHDQLVYTETLEIRWSGVPMANWYLIKNMRGLVNDRLFLGYPPESVRFTDYEVEEQAGFGGVDLFAIRFHFDVMTAPVGLAADPTEANLSEWLAHGIWNGQVGVWNRIWSKVALRTGVALDPATACTNWIPIRMANADCCGNPANRQQFYRSGCLESLFQIPFCPEAPPLMAPEALYLA